jgi:hypothetical protein
VSHEEALTKGNFAEFVKRLLAVPKQEVKDLERKAQKPKTRRKPKPKP